jgi:hypothetical protein
MVDLGQVRRQAIILSGPEGRSDVGIAEKL